MTANDTAARRITVITIFAIFEAIHSSIENPPSKKRNEGLTPRFHVMYHLCLILRNLHAVGTDIKVIIRDIPFRSVRILNSIAYSQDIALGELVNTFGFCCRRLKI